MRNRICVIIPNWNGAPDLPACLRSLQAQTLEHEIVVVDNGSVDESLEILEKDFPDVTVIRHAKNLGFAGGVNGGLRYALKKGHTYAALFNNDAVAHPRWLEHLANTLDKYPQVGIVTCKFMAADKSHLDSTGDLYSIWGLMFPRGRGEPAQGRFTEPEEVFGASGGASLYRVAMLKEIGLFDEDFFAYFEDIDLSFRAQLAGWRVRYEPAAEAYHATGTTSGRIKGFGIYQSFKNHPLVVIKDVPGRLLPTLLPRFILAYTAFGVMSLLRGHGWYAFKGWLRMLTLMPRKLGERRRIQKSRTVSLGYIDRLILHDLPPDQRKLRALRAKWWRLSGRKPAGTNEPSSQASGSKAKKGDAQV